MKATLCAMLIATQITALAETGPIRDLSKVKPGNRAVLLIFEDKHLVLTRIAAVGDDSFEITSWDGGPSQTIPRTAILAVSQGDFLDGSKVGSRIKVRMTNSALIKGRLDRITGDSISISPAGGGPTQVIGIQSIARIQKWNRVADKTESIVQGIAYAPVYVLAVPFILLAASQMN